MGRQQATCWAARSHCLHVAEQATLARAPPDLRAAPRGAPDSSGRQPAWVGSASGASVVAIDNKIEQAMVSGITASLSSPDLASAYVTQGSGEGGFAAVSGSLLGPWQGRELRHLHLSTSHTWQGPELIGCKRTAVPLQSLGWGRGHTHQAASGCRALGHQAVSNHFIVPWSLRTLFSACSAVIRIQRGCGHAGSFPQGQCPVWPGCRAAAAQYAGL
ncbi:TSC22D3 [Cervus elaphus hippelaphus]|uniref:TSC22D3 n=1 Tax=Cervus elaphus hippelaphus TaxID=46360 RepID=A0A212BZ82_CEREH|nr:TSC22D3 [Cervus elaphus hippelaphus]